ncbi:MAG: B12-binding domain-containing radical SAM protein [Armatimonadetes bacterium]|nr:B12-binding domain-containing radical SAM protein [Armatimonadota bacterium]
MKVKMILPALTEARSPYWRSIKYSLFPPLGLATLAGYLGDSDEVTIHDEHVERLDLNDEPDLVVIETYITSAHRSYEIADHYRAKGCYVVMGGLHVTSMPDEAAAHADTICLGPGEDTWPSFLADFRKGCARNVYRSRVRTLDGAPPVRRDLIKRHLYLAPNSLVVSRGCPHSCDFCYKDAFFAGGKSFYTQSVDAALAEIERLPGRHLFFLDDNIFADSRFANDLFDGMRGMGRIWQAAGTVQSVFEPGLLESAVRCGLRSLFVGFETLSASNLKDHGKYHNLHRDYSAAVRRLHDLGVMINASFVFGLEYDDESTPARTVGWAVEQGIETATFHILTPYPGTALHDRLVKQGRITSTNWDLYDTRHVVYEPAKVSPEALEAGYWKAYSDFYSWASIFKGAWAKEALTEKVRHVVYSGAWKKMEPLWKLVVQAKRVSSCGPLLEYVLAAAKRRRELQIDDCRMQNEGTTQC